MGRMVLELPGVGHAATKRDTLLTPFLGIFGLIATAVCHSLCLRPDGVAS